jgi:hypothetical protein
VTLPDGQQVSYVIDVTNSQERQQITVNALSGKREVTTHTAYQTISGVVVPFKSTMTIDGKFVHEVQLRAAQMNLGVMPWMFSRTSGSYIPGADAPALASDAGYKMMPTVESAVRPWLKPALAGDASFGRSRFPELDAETLAPLLQDLGEL